MRFFRAQGKNISFEQMQEFDSAAEYNEGPGLAVSSSPSGYDGIGGSRFGGAWDALDPDDELVILEGHIVRELYDGYAIRPTREVARFTKAQWDRMLEDETAYDYED